MVERWRWVCGGVAGMVFGSMGEDWVFWFQVVMSLNTGTSGGMLINWGWEGKVEKRGLERVEG